MEDALLWRSFREGSKQAFEALFTRYYKELYQYGFKMTRNGQLLDDCIQDLFFELWTGRAQAREVHSVKSYLFKSLKYKLYREIKRDQQTDLLQDEYPSLLEFSYESQLIEAQTRTAQRDRLLESVQQLTKRQQEAVYLRFYNQMDYEEIAAVMSITYQAAVNLVYKSVRLLRDRMLMLYSFLFLVLHF